MTIQPHSSAPLGSVTTLSPYTPLSFPPTSIILCRNTAPLISFAYTLLTRKIPCHVLGREIGQGLITLVEKLNAVSICNLQDKLTAYESREVAKASARNDETAAAAVEDRVRCLEIFISQLKEGSRTIHNLCQNIEDLFSDKASTSTLTLSTIHKAKGLEYDTVFILDRSLMPSKFAKSAWALAQERNLIYVAITRAKLNLFYISSSNWERVQANIIRVPQLYEQD